MRTRSSARWTSRFVRLLCRGVLRLVRVRSSREGALPPSGALLIANHIGWIDIVALLAHVDCTVVAKREVSRWPVVGWCARQLDVVFVDRTRKRDLLRAIPAVTSALTAGRRVLLFPEGTTGDGQQLLPFKSAMVEAAVQARAPVVPIAVRATARDPDPSALCWLGEETLLANLPRLRSLGDVRVTLQVGTPLWPVRHRKIATHRARSAIQAMLRGAAVCSRLPLFQPMRTPGLEPGWVAPPAPKAGASTNFATSAERRI